MQKCYGIILLIIDSESYSPFRVKMRPKKFVNFQKLIFFLKLVIKKFHAIYNTLERIKHSNNSMFAQKYQELVMNEVTILVHCKVVFCCEVIQNFNTLQIVHNTMQCSCIKLQNNTSNTLFYVLLGVIIYILNK